MVAPGKHPSGTVRTGKRNELFFPHRKDEEAVAPIIIENGARIIAASGQHSPDAHDFANPRQRRRAQESPVVDFNRTIDERKLPEQWNDSLSTDPMNFAAGPFLEHLDRRKSHHDVSNGA